MKPSFILHKDSLCVLEDLTNEQRGELFYAIYCYQIGTEIELSPIIKIAFSQFRNQFIRDEEKFKNTVEARKQAGSKGGKQRVANQANASMSKQTKANQAVSDNDSVNESESVNDNIFTFSLKTQKQFDSLSKEYIGELNKYIFSLPLPHLSFEDFRDGCLAKGYKYKNFKLAYNKWNKNTTHTKQPQLSFKQQDEQRAKEKSDNISRLLNAGFNPFNQSDWDKLNEHETMLMQEHQGVIDVQPTN